MGVDFRFFLNNHRWVLYALSIIYAARLLSATRRRPPLPITDATPCHHGNENCCTRAVEKNTRLDSLQTKATYKYALLLH